MTHVRGEGGGQGCIRWRPVLGYRRGTARSPGRSPTMSSRRSFNFLTCPCHSHREGAEGCGQQQQTLVATGCSTERGGSRGVQVDRLPGTPSRRRSPSAATPGRSPPGGRSSRRCHATTACSAPRVSSRRSSAGDATAQASWRTEQPPAGSAQATGGGGPAQHGSDRHPGVASWKGSEGKPGEQPLACQWDFSGT